MNSDTLLIVFGSLASILLTINAFFTRQTLQLITEVRLELAKISVKHDATDERSRRNEHGLMKISERMHSVEGGQKQTLALLDHVEEELENIKKRLNN